MAKTVGTNSPHSASSSAYLDNIVHLYNLQVPFITLIILYTFDFFFIQIILLNSFFYLIKLRKCCFFL